MYKQILQKDSMITDKLLLMNNKNNIINVLFEPFTGKFKNIDNYVSYCNFYTKTPNWINPVYLEWIKNIIIFHLLKNGKDISNDEKQEN